MNNLIDSSCYRGQESASLPSTSSPVDAITVSVLVACVSIFLFMAVLILAGTYFRHELRKKKFSYVSIGESQPIPLGAVFRSDADWRSDVKKDTRVATSDPRSDCRSHSRADVRPDSRADLRMDMRSDTVGVEYKRERERRASLPVDEESKGEGQGGEGAVGVASSSFRVPSSIQMSSLTYQQ